ncbi:IPTL-CTERM sorting domain-containing protein [Acidovorax sp.]|uniref:IPTL-CTERM sorting domain-containing protein n=1 Tax=Acidovorax sp. TaxID=1872122 RepID=UPI0039188F69
MRLARRGLKGMLAAACLGMALAAAAQSGHWRDAANPGIPRYQHAAALLASGDVLLTGGSGNAGVTATVMRYQSRDNTWTAMPDLLEPRELHTVTPLATGRVLVAGGYAGWPLASAEVYDPATGASVATPPLAVERFRHTATRLLSGRVLVAGGNLAAGSAEVFVPGSPGTWSATGAMQVRRQQHTATLLLSGKVLVVGGYSGAGVESSAELYDPATNTWSATGSMAEARTEHTATLLPSGLVLVAGGRSGSAQLASAELYDPATGTWSSVGPMAQARSSHEAGLLPNGEVIVFGGEDVPSAGFTATTERFDPSSGTWRADAPLGTGRMWHVAVRLADGEILALGGAGASGAVSRAERYHNTAGTGLWDDAQDMPSPRMEHRAFLLDTGKVLVFGGYGSTYLSSADLYDPAADQWAPAAPMNHHRYRFEAAKLLSGQVLATGGWSLSTSYSRTAEVYDPAADAWTNVPDMAQPRSRHSATTLLDGRVLVVGGEGSGSTAGSAELFDPATQTWSAAANPLRQRKGHAAVLLASGKVLVVGSDGMSGESNSELYDPATDSWTDAGGLGQAVGGATLTRLPSGEVLAVGGYGSGGFNGHALPSVYSYNPLSGWRRLADMYTPRAKHTAQLLSDGRVLIAGGDKSPYAVTVNGFAYASALLYDPALGTWTEASSLRSARASLVSVLLPSGRVLAMGQGTAADQYVPQYTVTPTVSSQGYFLPWTPQLVRQGDSASLQVQANAGWIATSATGCGGTLAGTTYTAGPVTQDCTVSAGFAVARTVTATAGAGGSISPSGAQAVADGATASFTVTPLANYQIASVTGCGGTLVQNLYTTAAVTQNCTVTASFTPILHTVTASAQSGGSISPAGAVSVAQGQTRAFNLAPDAGYRIAAVTGCGGTLAGSAFTTAAVMGACQVQARFETVPVDTSTGSGPVTVGVVNGSAGCRLDLAGTGPVAAPAPYPGAGTLPHGAFRLRLVNCQPGETVRVAVTFPSLAGLTIKKYGPTPASPTTSRYYDPANLQISGNTATYDVTDGGLGDDSFGALDGTINDPVVAVPLAAPGGAVGIPTLSGAGLAGMSLLLAGMAAWQRRRRRDRGQMF